MNNIDDLFPKIQKSIENLIEDEEGNIPGKKLLMLGTMMVVIGSFLSSMDVFAKHRSHSSHRSHRSSNKHSSHGSHTSHGSATRSHSNHSNHGSHDSHQSHQSHTSHSNTASHSNSKYSAEGDVRYSAPAANKVPTVKPPTVVKTTEGLFKLPNVNENIEMPNGTPTAGIMASFNMPASSTDIQIDAGDMNTPSITYGIE